MRDCSMDCAYGVYFDDTMSGKKNEKCHQIIHLTQTNLLSIAYPSPPTTNATGKIINLKIVTK